MTVQDFVRQNTAALSERGIQTARLDCLVLLEDALNTNRTHLLAYPEQIIPDEVLTVLAQNIRRRMNHEPLAYIRGHAAFYGRRFTVNQHVLIPRPESEALIDLLKQQTPTELTTIVDIGSGSGALAITAKCLFPDTRVIATDIDPACLEVAQRNAEKIHTPITFFEGSLLRAIPYELLKTPLILLCNLPYVPDGYVVNKDAAYEPPIALFAGEDGLDLYQDLFQQLGALTTNGTIVITEALAEQHTALIRIAQATGFSATASDGLAQCFLYI